MKAKIYKAPFDVHLPVRKACPQTGKALDAVFIKTIMVDVYDNFGHQMLTESAHLQIDKEAILAILATFIDDDMWMEIPNPNFDGAKPQDLLDSHEGQKQLIDFIRKNENPS